MKYFKKIKPGNNRGITLVWMALFMLPLVMMFAGLALDISYMYLAKNELQVAADAAALAGVPKLTGETDNTTLNPNVLIQETARQETWKFACKNTAANYPSRSPVYLANTTGDCENSNTLTANQLNGGNVVDGDIVVGNWIKDNSGINCATGWETAGSGFFCRANGSTGLSINAVKVVARRTGAAAVPGIKSGGNAASVFWGQIFRLLDTTGSGWSGWSLMSARASAIATQNVPYIAPLPICLPSCSLQTPSITAWGYDDNQPDDPFPACPEPDTDSILCSDINLPPGSGNSNSTDTPVTPPGLAFYLASSNQAECDPKKPGLAWTNFKTNECNVNPACDMPNKNEVEPYILGQKTLDPKAICNKNICTTNGNIHPLLNTFEGEFIKNKTNHVVNGGVVVNGWRVFVPIVSNETCGVPQQTCPGAQGGQANPYFVERFAEVIVTQVMTTGKQGIRIVGLSPSADLTDTFQCKEGGNMNIKTITRKVTGIGCQDCALPLAGTGLSARLVK